MRSYADTGSALHIIAHASPSAERLDLTQLGAMLREHRGKLSLRQAAAEAGVSFSTFTRIKAGPQPDLTSFTLLCAWLGVSPGLFFMPVALRGVAPIDEAIAHLAADPRLQPDAASNSKVADMLRSMYDALSQGTRTAAGSCPPPPRCFSAPPRSSAAAEAGVPQRLKSLLGERHDELAARVAAGEL